MSYKIILVHCDASKSVSHRLVVAAGLAQHFGSRLVGLHVRQPFEMPVFSMGGFAMDGFFKAYDEGVKAGETAASAAFARATKGKELATEWRVADGYVDSELAVQARYADLVVVGQAGSEPTATPSDLPEDRGAHDRPAGSRGAVHRRQAAGQGRPAVLECQPRGRPCSR